MAIIWLNYQKSEIIPSYFYNTRLDRSVTETEEAILHAREGIFFVNTLDKLFG